MFGFHLCELEWRQQSGKVVAALDEIVGVVEPGLAPLSKRAPEERAAWIERELTTVRPLLPRAYAFSAASTDIIVSLEAVAKLRARRGPQTVASLILANAEEPFEMLALLVLARACGALDAARCRSYRCSRARPPSQPARRSPRRCSRARRSARTCARAATYGK